MADVKCDIKINAPKVTKFTVGGKTLEDAKKALDKRDEWGLYDSTRGFKSSAKVDKDKKVTEVTMVINPIIELPDWSGYSKATKEQKASWDAMVKKLEAHERKHHDIQVDCVDALKKAIKDADDLDAKALNKIISDQQKACQKKQDSYDSSSGHGAKEGVTLDLDA
jgi:predicted secreted Zn-dependent protease